MKMFPPSAFAAVALALAMSLPADARQTGAPAYQHLAPDAMSAADRAAVQARQREIADAAQIYGYSFEAENWAYEQTLCAAMPETILLHYVRQFPDGTESLFTALLPRGTGRVRIVPVLYHNMTPFVPAPKNPSNYALFNELVPPANGGTGVAPGGKWLQMSACYAEMTGGRVNYARDSDLGLRIAGAPSPTIHLNVQDKTTRVTFADREGERTYRVWSVSFNRRGRITAAATEDRSVVAAKTTPPVQPAATPPVQPQVTAVTQPEPIAQPAVGATPSQPNAQTGANRPAPTAAPIPSTAQIEKQPTANPPQIPSVARVEKQPVANPPQVISSNATSSVAASTTETEQKVEQQSEPGWKFVLHPTNPPTKIVPPAPAPPEKITPQPRDTSMQTDPDDQSPQ